MSIRNVDNIDFENPVFASNNNPTRNVDNIDFENPVLVARDGKEGFGTAVSSGLKTGLGHFIVNVENAIDFHAKPSYVSDEDWQEKKDPMHKWVKNFGEELTKNNQVQYEPWSGNRIAQGVAGSVPFMVGLAPMAAVALRSGNANALRTAGQGFTTNLGLGSKATQFAGELLPAAALGTLGAMPEAEIEAQSAYDEAKAEGRTEDEAVTIRNEVRNLNALLLAGSNTIGLLTTFGNLPFKFPKNAGARIIAKLATNFTTEGGQEALQEIIPANAAGKNVNWNNVGEAGLIGGVTGAVFGGAGMGAEHYLDSATRNIEAQATPESIDSTGSAELLPESPQQNQQVRFNPLPVSEGVEDWEGVDDTTKNATYSFGQTLKDNYGIDPLITSGRRSAENNAAVNGSPTSHHLSGKAADIYLGEISDEMAEQVKADAIAAGWGEVLFHDAGTGKHLHLADFQGDVNNFGGATNVGNVDTSATSQLANDVFSYDEGNSSRNSDLMQARNFLENNSYLDYEDSGSAIFSTLEENDPDKIIAKAQELGWAKKEDSQTASEQNDIDILAEELVAENRNANSLQSRLGNMVGQARQIQIPTIRGKRQNPVTQIAPLKSEAISALNPKLLSITKKAFAGDQSAIDIFRGLKPNVQATLTRLVQGKQSNNTANAKLPSTQGLHPLTATNGIAIQDQANSAKVAIPQVQSPSTIEKALRNPKLMEMTSKALAGDEAARSMLGRLYPDVKQALIEGQQIQQEIPNVPARNQLLPSETVMPNMSDVPTNNLPVNQNDSTVPAITPSSMMKNIEQSNISSELLNNTQGKVVVRGDEFGEYKDLKELRDKVKTYYAQMLQGTKVYSKAMGDISFSGDGEIAFSGSGKVKMISTSAKINKLLLVKYLPQLIANASNSYSHSNMKNKRNVSKYSYLETEAIINGKVEPVTITIFTDVNGNKYYNHILQSEENSKKNKEDIPVYSTQAINNDNGIPTVGMSSIDFNISQAKPQVNKNLQRNIKEALNNDQLNETTKQALAGNKKSLDVLNKVKPEIRQALVEKNSEKLVRDDIDENIASGKKAMNKVIAEHADFENAMYRDDVGNISFVWGTPGKGNKFKRGSGISHIIAKRDFENGSGIKTAHKMVEVIAKGKITGRQDGIGDIGDPRVKIDFENHTAVLSMKENSSAWLLTGFGNKETVANANGEGFDSSVATAVTPTLTRSGRDATVSIKPNISQANKEVNNNLGRAVSKQIKDALKSDQLNETTKQALAGNKKSLDVLNQIKPEIRQALIEKNSEKIVESDKPEKEVVKAELAEGYRTESGKTLQEASEKEFVIKPDGRKDFGEITTEIESASNGAIKAGKICLQVGHGGYGLIHIKKRENDLKNLGYNNAESYIRDIASNFDEIYQSSRENTRFILVKRNKINGFMPIDLELAFDGENYHSIISAIPMKDTKIGKQIKKEVLIYSSRPNSAPVSNNGTVPRVNDNSVGVDTPWAASDKLNTSIKSNISQANKEVNSSPTKKEVQKESVFGKIEDRENDLLKSLGLSKVVPMQQASEKSFSIIDDSDQALEAAMKELQSELSNISANPMFNPNLMKAAFKVGAIHMQRGLNNFSSWSGKMIESVGEKIKPWLSSVWQALESYPKDIPVNDDNVSAIFGYVGKKYEDGVTDKNKIIDDFEKLVGKEQAKKFLPLFDSAYSGVHEYFNPSIKDMENSENDNGEGADNNVNDSASKLAERASKGQYQDGVGKNDVDRKPSRSDGQRSGENEKRGSKQGSGSSVRDSSTDTSREASNSRIFDDTTYDTERSSRDNRLSGCVVSSLNGVPVDNGRATGRDVKTTANRQKHESNLLTVVKKDSVKKNSVSYKAGDLESIQSDLPMLLKGQQSDVVFAEKRLLLNKGQGVLFTNGTGTGKTYTGLGLVKRYLNQGKKNILIVAPSNEIIAAWKDAARKDFGINTHQLNSVIDKGSGVTITTYANLQDNDAVLSREWDLVITDEAHNLMNNEKGVSTGALEKLRAMTYHNNALKMRVDFVVESTNKDIISVNKKIRDLSSRLQASKKLNKESKLDIQPVSEQKLEEIQNAIKGLETKKATINNELEAERRQQIEIWQSMPKENKPKVVFLSATPFAYVKNIDYAEGYLFEYPPIETGYNIAGGFDKFMIENFGYRMMYNRLTIPEGKVDNRIMEVGFHEKLKKDGVLSARKLEVTADYERGFLLVEKGIGAKIDEGFEWFFDNDNASFRELGEVLSKQFNGRIRNYMLESIKARGAIDIVKQYLSHDKKVVIFHDSKKVQNVIHPFKLDVSKLREKDDAKELRNQYAQFKAKRPDLVNMDLSSLVSPISTFEKAFGEDIMFFNGDISVKKRSENVKDFNDDNSGKNIIMVQSDAGNAGISLHDTTGKYQRVLINIGIPRRPSYATQIEGRIFRLGSVSNAIIRYLSTGTNVEKGLFANTIASRASTAENLAMGEDARNLRDSYVSLFTETLDGTWENRLPGAEGEGTGGKELDSMIGSALTEFERAKTFYYGQQKRNSRNKSREGVDYFATPEPVGLKMVEWAGLVDGETVLEPSAGHGAISRFFSPNTPSVIIEPSSQLAPLAQMNTDGATLSKGSFESYHLVNKFNAVVMNPPYGTAGKTAMEHLEKAFKHLKDGGRLIAIVPNGPSMDKRFDSWYESKEASFAHLIASVKLPSATFGRAGTGVNTKIIVLDKYNDKNIGDEIYQKNIDLRDAKTVEELFDKIENISMPKRLLSSTVEANKNSKASAIAEGELFSVDTHLNTRTKKEQYRASMTKGVARATYEKIAGVAKKNSGYYSSFAKGFLFENSTNRDSFVVQVREALGENTDEDNVSFSIRENDVGKNYSELRKQGLSRPKALDTLVEEYQDQNYDAKNPLPGYAQHEELTQEEVENIYRDIDEKLDHKFSPYYIALDYILEYNANMGEVLSENISDKVRKIARLKGELHHASEYLSEIRGLIRPDSNRTDTEENIYSRIAQTIGTESTGNSRRTSRTKETRSYSLRQESTSGAEETGRGHGLGFERSGYLGEESGRARESSTRSTTEWLSAIKEAFPAAKNISQEAENAFVFELANKRKLYVNIVDEILLTPTEYAKAKKDYGENLSNKITVDGKVQTVGADAIITLARDADKSVIEHEGLHFAEQTVLNTAEKLALNKRYLSQEQRAEAYREWRQARKNGKGTLFGKLWQKIYDFAKQVQALFSFENKHNVFRKVESGEVWEREVGDSFNANNNYSKEFSVKKKMDNPWISEDTRAKLIQTGKNLVETLKNTAKDKSTLRKHELITEAPDMLQEFGMQNLPIKITRGLALNVMKPEKTDKHAHGITYSMLEQIPLALNEPVFVIKSATRKDSIVVFTDIKDDHNRSLIVPIVISNNNNVTIVPNWISSIYGRNSEDTFFVKQYLGGNVLYANSKKSLEWVNKFRLQLPKSLLKQSSLLEQSIAKKNQNVNSENSSDGDVSFSIRSEPEPENLTPIQRVAGVFSNTERKTTWQSAKDYVKEEHKSLYRYWMDKNNSLHGLDEAMSMGLGRKLEWGEKIYNRSQMLQANAAGLAHTLISGDKNAIDAVNERLKNKQLPHEVSMADVLSVVDRKAMNDKYPMFLKDSGFSNWIDALGSYLGSIRLIEMHRLNKLDYQERLASWEESGRHGRPPKYVEYKLPTGITLSDLRETVRSVPPEFKTAAGLYYKLNDNILTVMEDAGLISEDIHKLLNTKYKYYCPMMRDFSDTAAADEFIGGLQGLGRGVANVSTPLSRISIKGSTRKILNPLESTIKAISVVTNRAERNKVGQMVVAASGTEELKDIVQKVEGGVADEKNSIFTVMHKGKKVAYKTSPEYYGAIAGYSEGAAGFTLGLARNAARLLRAGATTSPSFIIRNLIRDTLFAGISSQTGFIPFVDTFKGMRALLKNPKLKAEFEAAGVNKFNFYGSSENIVKSLDDLAGGKDLKDYGVGDIWNALMKYPAMASELVESSTRMGEFMRARNQGISIDEAAWLAKEVTLDFSRSGIYGGKVNQIVPFFNACLQGGDKMFRLLKENRTRTLMQLGKYIVLPTVLLWCLNHDEEWYKELDQSVKNTNWVLPGGIRIPKPQEAGILFGSGIEAFLDMTFNQDPTAVREWARTFRNNAVPNIMPTLLLPMLEWSANYSFFRGQKIAGRRLEQLPDEQQFNPSTSEVAKAIGSTLKLSPVKIDNLIRGYTGTMGMFLAQSLDPLAEEKRNLPAKKLSERAFIRDFMLTDSIQNRSVNDFYDMLERANKEHAGYGVKGKPSFAVKAIRKAGQAISNANKDIRNITISPTLTPEEKRERIDKRKEFIKMVARNTNTKYGKFFSR